MYDAHTQTADSGKIPQVCYICALTFLGITEGIQPVNDLS